MRSEAGQITIEAVLVLTILVSTIFAGTNLMRDQQILSRMVQGPWSYMAGMIENGFWAPPQAGRSKHPNHITRHGSPQGDAP
ncbi:MAG: hypothetical protein AAF203_11310 [Pseudomonadota bacterium]